jgi:elongation factor 1 alpha-like protein
LASPSSGRPLSKARRDLSAELAARAQGKPTLNLVVAGHVDAGKSTLMGRLLYELGDVSAKTLQKVGGLRPWSA